MTLPNILTCLRVVLIPVFMVLAYQGNTTCDFAALVVYVVACLTDYVDGNLARKNNQVTNFGKFMDPIADKLLVCSALICLTGTGEIPVWATIIIIAREFAVSGIRLVASDNGVTIAASWWGKSKTIAQMVMIIVILANLSFLSLAETILIYVSVVLTLISAADYLIKNRKAISFDK